MLEKDSLIYRLAVYHIKTRKESQDCGKFLKWIRLVLKKKYILTPMYSRMPVPVPKEPQRQFEYLGITGVMDMYYFIYKTGLKATLYLSAFERHVRSVYLIPGPEGQKFAIY
jgi:hypothetical protein